MGVTKINQLSDEEKARFNEWGDRWIGIGLRTGSADRERFEAAGAETHVWRPSDLDAVAQVLRRRNPPIKEAA